MDFAPTMVGPVVRLPVLMKALEIARISCNYHDAIILIKAAFSSLDVLRMCFLPEFGAGAKRDIYVPIIELQKSLLEAFACKFFSLLPLSKLPHDTEVIYFSVYTLSIIKNFDIHWRNYD